MAARGNVLIVEDDFEWCRIYERAVAAADLSVTVRIAQDLAGATRLIELVKFTVAFVDIGLDVSDDSNVDGLLVMEGIRAAGDETSIVMVTGRAGRDVLPITRDVIRKYGAYEAVGKMSVTPSDIGRLLRGGLNAYRSAVDANREVAAEALLRAAGAMRGDRQYALAVQSGTTQSDWLDFLDELLGEYLPIAPISGSRALEIDDAAGVAYGNYWSRSAVGAVFVCIGAAEKFDEFMDATGIYSRLPENHGFGGRVKQLFACGVKGGVFLLRE